jgi:hypothetical protein
MISPSATINESADFWFYNAGVNVITADTINKKIYENWSQFQFVPISDEIHEENKRNRNYRKCIAIILGKIWRGEYAGKYLVAIDLDKKKAIEEFFRKYCKYNYDNSCKNTRQLFGFQVFRKCEYYRKKVLGRDESLPNTINLPPNRSSKEDGL